MRFVILVILAITSIGFGAGNDVRLIQAVKSKDATTIRTLLRSRIDVNATQGDGATALQNLDSAHWTIMNLLRNERWSKFPANGAWNDQQPVRIEAVTRGSRKHIFGNRMINHDTPTAELQMDLTVTHRTSFPPIIPDTLNMIHVTVAYPWPYDPNLNEPFTVQYNLPILGAFDPEDYSKLSPDFAEPPLSSP